MRLVILGATGRIGRQATEAALRDGHEVVTLVRRADALVPRDRLEVRVGELLDDDAARAALSGSAGVIAALGPRSNTPAEAAAIEAAMRAVVAGMRAAGVRRLVTLSGAGVDVPGDGKPALDRLITRLVRRVARYVVEAKQREYEVIAVSGLDWTALRPPLVVDGSSLEYRLSSDLRPGARVQRAAVGRALVDQVADTSWVHAAPFVLPAGR